MTDLLIHDVNVTKLISSELSGHEDGFVAMLQVPEENYLEVNLETIKVLVNEFNYSGLYITIQRPYNTLLRLFGERGINADMIYFIDAASSTIKEGDEHTQHCMYVASDLNVDDLTKAVYKTIEVVQNNKKFLFIDSITTFMLFQPLSETLRFAEFLTRTLRKSDLSVVVLNVGMERARERFIKDIVFQCDETVKIEWNG